MIYSCEICNEQYCDKCEPSLLCEFCEKTICGDCEESLTFSDYVHRVICKECFPAQDKKEKEKLLKEKNSKKLTSKANSIKLKPANKKDIFKEIRRLGD